MNDELSDRLKKLGLHLGADHLKSPNQPVGLPNLLNPKHEFQNRFGNSIALEQYYDQDYVHGLKPYFNKSLPNKQIIVSDNANLLFKDCVFIDTETTGLSQTTGTFAFMVGVGVIQKGRFYLRQYFLRNPGEEQAMLLDLANFIEPYKVLVSYNGIGFDVPILSNRYKLYRLPHPLKQKAHIDLLKYARKLWRFQYNDRSLKSIETNVLKFHRGDEEIPGWMVPDMYREYIKTGNIHPINGVFYHNAIDIVSLGVLLDVVNEIYSESQDFSQEFDTINFALALSHQKDNNPDEAIKRYTEALNQTNLSKNIKIKTLENLGFLYKKNNLCEKALPFWSEAAELGSEKAMVELAKYFEHHSKTYQKAVNYVEQLIGLMDNKENQIRRKILLPELEHRKQRLYKKILKENEMKDAQLIYRAPGMLAAKSIQILLESFQIQSQVIQESAGIAYGFTAGGLGSANIYVSKEDEIEALKVIELMESGALKIEDDVSMDQQFDDTEFEDDDPLKVDD
jgi:uncharacterized protein YprB with RNaseH-like and TPR domain